MAMKKKCKRCGSVFVEWSVEDDEDNYCPFLTVSALFDSFAEISNDQLIELHVCRDSIVIGVIKDGKLDYTRRFVPSYRITQMDDWYNRAFMQLSMGEYALYPIQKEIAKCLSKS